MRITNNLRRHEDAGCIPDCPSSDGLGQFVRFRNGGSGSYGCELN